ncbi:uncharacterized protein F4807DRAFT_328757 [Annulohypoxylon truncatum]|uniref:uncharacterized protein n=1 Tax=Annulohypoxylon truncatum TaxID=327061 RepID=UPI002008CFCF|nr:uncharacterized protein F4807DRAFT_328757 [Annulohypoxylon truncatum]KAI1204523.1 hypothetical protein F4807DRAFT_328757 [Annulohypoxylon truncatum]
MESDEDTAAAMAEAMGFSSFGMQNANKRRKFNPRADEAVTASTTIPLHQSGTVKEARTGSNTTPLGVRTRNEDEIDLEEDEDEPNVSKSDVRDSLNDQSNDNPGPQYMDTSRPPTAVMAELNDDIQSKIDSITGVSSDQAWGTPSSTTSIDGGTSYRGGRGRGGHQASRGRGRGRGGGQGHEPGKKWWEGYYDPSTNTNPWEALEKASGLEPVGSWMSWEEAKSRSGQASVS